LQREGRKVQQMELAGIGREEPEAAEGILLRIRLKNQDLNCSKKKKKSRFEPEMVRITMALDCL
jgi:hypothetical protein